MSTPTNMSAPPFQQFIYPPSAATYAAVPPPPPAYSFDPNDILGTMQNNSLNTSIYDGTTKVIAAINDNGRLFTSEFAGLNKDVIQSSLGLRDAIERGNLTNGNAIERTSGITQNIIERVAGENRMTTITSDAASRQAAADTARDIMRAVDHNGANGMSTTERVGSNLSTGLERIGGNTMATTERVGSNLSSGIERNGGNIMTAIERVAGEGRLTTTVTDAATRQASADSARDIAIAVERNGGNGISATQNAQGAITTAIERNAGENRMTTVTMAGQTDNRMTDIRHAVIGEVNRSTNELLGVLRGNTEDLHNAVSSGAWENRTAMATGFNQSMVEALKSKAELSQQSSQEYASLVLENAKSDALLSNQASNQYASLLLEQQKVKEYLSSKGDGHFAMNQLELQKVKEGLACQASNHFSINQLEQQKIRESLTLQMADAKYEALKSQQFLADKIAECCCKTGDKIDNIDRDRLRDNLSVERTDNNLLKVLEFSNAFDGRGYGHGHGHRGRHHGRH